MANSIEARLILGRELWDELGESSVRVSVEGKPCTMRIRNFWTSCMHTELMIRSPKGARKWLPELAGPGRSPALVDFLEFCKDFKGVFEVVKSSDLSPAEFDLIREHQSRLQETAQAGKELLEQEQAAKELAEQKQAARKAKNQRKRNKSKGKNTPPENSGEGAGDLNAGSDEASKKEETRVKGAEEELQLEAASDSLQETGIQDEEASKENQEEASEVLEAETEENQEEEASKENQEEASKFLREEETVYISLKGKRVPVNETTLYKLLSGRDDVLQAVQSVQKDLKEVKKDLKDMHFDISMVCEASGRAIVKAFAEDKYGMLTAVPLPHSLPYPVADEVEVLARLCPSPVGESPREVPTNADIDCYLAFKADLQNKVLIAEITRADLHVQSKYVHPPENLEKPTPSSKLLYKLVQLERAITAVEATSGVGSVKAAVLASPAFRHLSPENRVLLLKSVLDKCGGKLKNLERLAAHDLHTLAL